MRSPAASAVLLAILLAFPTAVTAQVGVGVHVGTIGLGSDLAIALGERAQLRGGAGLVPIEPSLTFSDIDFTVELPSSFIIAGIDFFPTDGGFRIGGGILIKPDNPSITGEFSGTVNIGPRTYTGAEVGSLTGVLETKSAAPYLMIGFGKQASRGIGLFLDLGAAFVGESTLTLEADGLIASDAQFRTDLERERRDIQDDIDKYFKIYPIVNLGLRIGVGG